MTSVYIEPVSTNKFRSITQEPQMMQIRSTNTSFLYLDAQSSELELNKTDMILSSIHKKGDRANTLAQGIVRLAIESFAIFYDSPNVNPYNNNIIFNNGTNNYSVFVPIGFYTTATALITAIVAAMNTVTGSSGLTFSFTTVSYSPIIFNLNAAGGSFFIQPTCTAVLYGEQLWNLPNSTTLVTTTLVGAMQLFYTRYVDLCSNRLNSYAKISSLSNSGVGNIIFRLFLVNPTFPNWLGRELIRNVSFSFSPDDSLSSIDFQVKDQFGFPLYIPPGAPGTGNGFLWDAAIILEI